MILKPRCRPVLIHRCRSSTITSLSPIRMKIIHTIHPGEHREIHTLQIQSTMARRAFKVKSIQSGRRMGPMERLDSARLAILVLSGRSRSVSEWRHPQYQMLTRSILPVRRRGTSMPTMRGFRYPLYLSTPKSTAWAAQSPCGSH